jgi:predicted amidohydrolase YtcJ
VRIDTLFTNGRFRTLDATRPTASRLGVVAGRVLGFDEELDGVVPAAVIDLGGAPVVPGFNDAHQHLSMRGQRLSELDLRASVTGSLDDLYAKVAARAASLPAGAWIRGSGYDQNKIGAHPTRSALDAVAGDHPVWLAHTSAHMGVVNTAALTAMGFSPSSVPDVDGGTVVRDDQGLSTGLLTEQAQGLVFDLLRPAPFEDFVAAIGAGSRAAAADGLTSFTEPGVGLGRVAGNGTADVAAFQVARQRRLLLQRATLMPVSGALHAAGEDWFGLDLGVRTGFGDEWLRIGPVKVFSDGSLLGRTAAMRAPFESEPDNVGFFQEPQAELREFILQAHAYGWQVGTHAIGDLAVGFVLDTYAEALASHPRPDARHRIEHAGVTTAADLARMVALGVIPVPQGRFIGEIGDGMLAALGPTRAQDCYRLRSFVDAGITLPGSSDSPVVDGSPLLGIHDMVNRLTADGVPFSPSEALTASQALRAYTHGSAYAVHEEHQKGTLSRGKLADFTVLSDDLLSVPAAKIRTVTVGATIVGGTVVYDAGALRS